MLIISLKKITSKSSKKFYSENQYVLIYNMLRLDAEFV